MSTRTLMIAAAAPPVALAMLMLALLVSGAAGDYPLWRFESMNMTEAAAARDVATIAWMLGQGEDPNLRRPVRDARLDGAGETLTPIEAGVRAGRLEVVSLLIDGGATLDDRERTALACAALEDGHEDVAQYLAGGGPPSCG